MRNPPKKPVFFLAFLLFFDTDHQKYNIFGEREIDDGGPHNLLSQARHSRCFLSSTKFLQRRNELFIELGLLTHMF